MPQRLLNRDEQDLLQSERSLLDRLGLSLARLEARREDQDRLEQARRQLDELFLLVVVGEFNAGKSAFINALLGETLLEEGATPTTVRVHVLRHGEGAAQAGLGRRPGGTGKTGDRAVEGEAEIEEVVDSGVGAGGDGHEARVE